MEFLIALAAKLLYPAVGAAVTYAGHKLRQFIMARIENEKLETLLLKIEEAVETATQSVQQETVNDLKEAANDGKLSKEEVHRVKTEAVRRAKVHLATQGLKDIKNILGMTFDSTEEYLSNKVETMVLKLKTQEETKQALLKDIFTAAAAATKKEVQ